MGKQKDTNVDEYGKYRSKKWAKKWICVSLVLIILSCIGASMLQTNWGKTQVYTFKVPTSDGKYISCNMFRPKEANADHKVPVVIATAGTYASKEQMDIPGIELSRRGIAVITFDPYMHGMSSGGTEPYSEFAWTDAGMIALVEFASKNLDFVDTSRIGVTGHSLGGRIISNTLAYYGVEYEKALKVAQDPESEQGAEVTEAEYAKALETNKINSAFAAGVQTSEISFGKRDDTFAMHGIKGAPDSKEFPSRAYSNIAVYNGFNDEFQRGNHVVDGKVYGLGTHPDMLALVNNTLDTDYTELKMGHFYGSAEDRSIRVIYNPPEFHALERFSVVEAAALSDFFTTSFEMGNPIPSQNQYWLIKEFFNCIGLVGMFLLVVPLASAFLHIPFFTSLKTPVPARLPAISTKKSKIIFWGTWIFSAVVSWRFFIPAIKIADMIWPIQSAQATLTWTFPQKMTNFILVWALFNAIVGLLLFYLNYHFFGKKNGVTPEYWGIKTNKKELGKTLLLAFVIATCFFSIVFIANYFFVTDFRIWTLAIKVFKPIHLVYGLTYIPMFFIYYVSVSVTTNCSRRVEGQKEWVNLLICGLGNIMGLVLMQGLMYSIDYATGINPYGTACLNCIQTYQLLVLLFIVPYLCRYLFKLTGKIWLGSMLSCMLVVMINVANSMLHIPA